MCFRVANAVSYTHLDVYKRQDSTCHVSVHLLDHCFLICYVVNIIYSARQIITKVFFKSVMISIILRDYGSYLFHSSLITKECDLIIFIVLER